MVSTGARVISFAGTFAMLMVTQLSGGGLGVPPQAQAQGTTTVDEFRELLHVDPRIVNPYLNGLRSHNGGPNAAAGPWSFRGLIEDLARQAKGGVAPSAAFLNQYVSSFLESWLHDFQLVNGQLVKLPPGAPDQAKDLKARDINRVKNALLEGRADGFATLTSGLRTYELWRAPFDLIAIVNRMDLQDGSHAGELRFVFQLRDKPEFTVIFEYQMPTQPWDLNRNAREWHRLASLTVGSEEFLRQLELITSRATKWAPSATTFPVRLAQVRTNELEFAPANGKWELRMFRLNSSGLLVPTPVVNTPQHGKISSAVLGEFLRCHASALTGAEAASFLVPNTFDNCPDEPLTIAPISMVGTQSTAGIPWASTDPLVNPTAMNNFGMLTCNGCHEDNKNVNIPGRLPFLHIAPTSRETSNNFERMTGRGRLSLFLSPRYDDSGNLLACPPGANCSELSRRKQKLQALLATPNSDVCAADLQCGAGMFCVAGQCESTPAHCHNWRTDANLGETGPDCGGQTDSGQRRCGACPVGVRCVSAADCAAGNVCTSNLCSAP